MITPTRQDAIHKAHLYRLLMSILDDSLLSHLMLFKGGTCAAMLGWIGRFSVDLDFDLERQADSALVRERLLAVYEKLGLSIRDESLTTVQYFLRYTAPESERNTIKLEAVTVGAKANMYDAQFLAEIDRFAICQTKETAFANKLIALTDRYAKHGTVAGRDVYDIHAFLISGTEPNAGVIEERSGMAVSEYLEAAIEFIRAHVTQRVIDQDLNTLLLPETFQRVRHSLKEEVLMLLADEIRRGE